MSNKFIALVGNGQEELEAISSTSGAPDANKIISTGPDGYIDLSLIQGAEVGDKVAFENLSAGDLVHIRTTDGQMEKADATTTGKPATGFVKAAVTAAPTGSYYTEGKITGLTGLTQGAEQFLSTTAGGRTETVPAATGNSRQSIGNACSATEIRFEAGEPIKRA